MAERVMLKPLSQCPQRRLFPCPELGMSHVFLPGGYVCTVCQELQPPVYVYSSGSNTNDLGLLPINSGSLAQNRIYWYPEVQPSVTKFSLTKVTGS